MSLDNIDKQIEAVRAKAHSVNDTLRANKQSFIADRSRSDEGKQEAIATANNQARQKLQELQQEEDAIVKKHMESLERIVIGSVGTDPSSVINYRDAQDRAERLTDPNDAARVMTRALRSGDKSLATAVAQVALANRWNDVYQGFAEANPNIAESASDLVTLTRFATDVSFSLQRAMTYAVNA